MKWTHVSWFGNTPLARAVAFIPIVAQFAIYSDRYLPENWGLENTLWLYWSLNLLAIGQLIYFSAAPRAIKQYGGNIELYVEKSLATWSSYQFQVAAAAYIRSHFAGWGEGSLRLSPIGQSLNSTMLDEVDAVSNKLQEVKLKNMRQSATNVIRNLVRRVPLAPPVGTANSKVWADILEELSGEPLSDVQQQDLSKFTRFIKESDGDTKWKVDVLQWEFRRFNQSRRIAIMLVALFYLSGSVYFFCNTCRNLVEVLRITF